MQLTETLEKAEKYLMSLQKPDGSWVGEVELNPGPTAQAVMLYAAIRQQFPAHLKKKAAHYIVRARNSAGGWSAHFGEPSEVSLCCECYIALRILGYLENDPVLVRAREQIVKLGGLKKANPWTQLYSAVLGILHWNQIHLTPIQLMSSPPSWAPTTIDDMSYWVKVITVPMSLLGSLGPWDSITLAHVLRVELGGDEVPVKAIAKILGAISWKKKSAQQECLRRIENFTEAHGDFGGNTCTAMNVLLSYYKMGQQNTPAFKKGLECLLSYGLETDQEWHLQTCQSHIWDTAFALIALSANPQQPEIKKATAWLRDRQILTVKGDWSRNVKQAPGGWCFGNHHDHYPVTDCTAVSLMALAKQAPDYLQDGHSSKGVQWLMGMQSVNGGWAAYEKYEKGEWVNRVVKFKDLENALVDIPKGDVSSKVCEALAAYKSNIPTVSTALKNGRKFLLEKRTVDGLWAGNYGVNYLYGTSFSAQALRQIDQKPMVDWAPQVTRFFLATQKPDGGWGESVESYKQKRFVMAEASSPVQTAWALMGLASSSTAKDAKVKAAIVRGLDYLQRTQKSDGSWAEEHYLGTVFPGMVYFRYHLYPIYFPIMALQKVKRFLNE